MTKNTESKKRFILNKQFFLFFVLIAVCYGLLFYFAFPLIGDLSAADVGEYLKLYLHSSIVWGFVFLPTMTYLFIGVNYVKVNFGLNNKQLRIVLICIGVFLIISDIFYLGGQVTVSALLFNVIPILYAVVFVGLFQDASKNRRSILASSGFLLLLINFIWSLYYISTIN